MVYSSRCFLFLKLFSALVSSGKYYWYTSRERRGITQIDLFPSVFSWIL